MSSGQSKAMAVFTPGGECKPWTFDLMPLSKNDVEIKLTHSGVCHSDLHTLDGDWGEIRCPLVVGHELLGKVTAIGSEVTKFKIGDVVGVGPFAYSCNSCNTCNNKFENYCPDKKYTYDNVLPNGYVTKGGYAEYNRTTDHWVFKIPESYDPKDYGGVAPLLCAGVTVYTPLKRCNVKEGTRVGVVGIGGLGHCAIKFAKAMGATVTAISSSANKEAEAKSFGADNFLVSSNKEAMAASKRSFDVLVNTVSADLDWSMYLETIDALGTFVQLGAPPADMKLEPSEIIGRGISIMGSLVGNPQDYEDMFAIAGKHNILCQVEEFPFENVNECIAKLRKNALRYRGVLVMDQ